MAYVIIDDFRLGMDRRKARVSGVAGALWEGINGHINRGGDFERRKKFVKKYGLPAGLTHGMAQINGQIYVFGSGSKPFNMPGGVIYQRLAHTSSANLTQLLDVTNFGGKIYAVVAFDNGDIYHYYDGSRVTSWDTVAASIASNTTIASALANKINLDPRYAASAIGSVITIAAEVAGTPFTISASAVNHGATDDQTLTLATVQANVADTPEQRATMSIDLIDGVLNQGPNSNLTSGIVFLEVTEDGGATYKKLVDGGHAPFSFLWTGDPVTAAARLAAIINTNSTTTGYTATIDINTRNFDNTLVRIKAPVGSGATANNYSMRIYASYGLNFNVNENISGVGQPAITTPFTFSVITDIPNVFNNTGWRNNVGVDEIPAVAQVTTATVGGTFEGADVFTLTIDGINYITTGLASGMGITALTYQSKVYSVTTSLLEFCAVGDPTAWASGTGFGFINMTNQNADNEALVGIQQYQNRIAIFSRDNIQIWLIAVDPSQNTFQQSVQNTGALSTRSIAQYGNIDVFYLNDSGVRSVRARDASNAPAVNDVGVAIDAFIQAFIATLSGSQVGRACAVIEPLDGRYWLALNNRIFVYSFFPGSKISAWTYYDLTDEIGSLDISDMIKVGNRVYLRAGDNIFLYGGDGNMVYPNAGEILATISLPFLSASKPATVKGVKGFDIACTGEWKATLLPDPTDDTKELEIGTFVGTSLSPFTKNPIEMPCTLMAAKLVCSKAGPATVSKAIIHFDAEDEK